MYTYIGSTDINGIIACIHGINTVDYSKIYLQFSWNLKLGGTKLKIRVKAGYDCIEGTYIVQNQEMRSKEFQIRVLVRCAYIKSICIAQNIELWDTELSIWVGASLPEKSIKFCYI